MVEKRQYVIDLMGHRSGCEDLSRVPAIGIGYAFSPAQAVTQYLQRNLPGTFKLAASKLKESAPGYSLDHLAFEAPTLIDRDRNGNKLSPEESKTDWMMNVAQMVAKRKGSSDPGDVYHLVREAS